MLPRLCWVLVVVLSHRWASGESVRSSDGQTDRWIASLRQPPVVRMPNGIRDVRAEVVVRPGGTSRVTYAPGDNATMSPQEMKQLYEIRKRKEQQRIMSILLRVNGMKGHSSGRTSPPPKSHPNHVVKHSKKLQKQLLLVAGMRNYSEDDSKRIIQTILLPSCHVTSEHNWTSESVGSKPREFLVSFNVVPLETTLQPETIRVKSAVLMLRRKEIKTRGKKHQLKSKKSRYTNLTDLNSDWKVKVQFLTSVSDARKQRNTRKNLKSVTFKPRNSTAWIKISIPKAVDRWYRTSVRTPSVLVTVVDSRNRPVDPFQVFYHCRRIKHGQSKGVAASASKSGGKTGGSGKETKHNASSAAGRILDMDDISIKFPFLNVVAIATPKKFVKRSSHSSSEMSTQERRCHKRTVEIPFGKWDARVVSPESFTSAVCIGTCRRCQTPHSLRQKAGNANSTSALQVGDDDCSCRPVKWRPLKGVVYLDDTDPRRTKQPSDIPGMIVTACGCTKEPL